MKRGKTRRRGGSARSERELPSGPNEWEACTRKVRYSTRAMAELDASSWGDLEAYRCPFCCDWHLAKKKVR